MTTSLCLKCDDNSRDALDGSLVYSTDPAEQHFFDKTPVSGAGDGFP
jgi:hypothetical protein